MTVTIDDIVDAINDFTYLSCQTKTESKSTPPTNTTANILYSSSSRRQGNLTSFFEAATTQILGDETTYGVTLSDIQLKMAYAYLIEFYYERKFKDWNATSVTSGNQSINKLAGSAGSSSWNNYINIFEQAANTSYDSTIEQHSDYKNYPKDWHNIQIINIVDTNPIKNS